MRVLVCGGRDYDFNNYAYMKYIIALYFDVTKDTLIHGCALGADWMSENCVRMLASRLGIEPNVEKYPPDWKQYGKYAGPIRNKQMLDEGKPDIVIAFPGGKGTANMIKQAQEAGVKVVCFGHDLNLKPDIYEKYKDLEH